MLDLTRLPDDQLRSFVARRAWTHNRMEPQVPVILGDLSQYTRGDFLVAAEILRALRAQERAPTTPARMLRGPVGSSLALETFADLLRRNLGDLVDLMGFLGVRGPGFDLLRRSLHTGAIDASDPAWPLGVLDSLRQVRGLYGTLDRAYAEEFVPPRILDELIALLESHAAPRVLARQEGPPRPAEALAQAAVTVARSRGARRDVFLHALVVLASLYFYFVHHAIRRDPALWPYGAAPS